jgi:hypothetical protein
VFTREPVLPARLKTVLLFVACGFASGFGASAHFRKVLLAEPAGEFPMATLFVDGGFFLLALTCAFIACRILSWLRAVVPLRRYLMAAPIVLASCPVGIVTGYTVGAVLTLAVARAYRPISRITTARGLYGSGGATLQVLYPAGHAPHILFVLCVACGIGLGTVMVAVCLWEALYIVAPQRSSGVVAALLLSAVVITTASSAIVLTQYKTFLASWIFWAVAKILGQSLYGGCAGYWLSLATPDRRIGGQMAASN